MFLRTNEFDAGFGVQPPATEEPQHDDHPRRTKSPWRRVAGAIRRLMKRAMPASAARRRSRPAWLAIDGLDDHMLKDIGLTRDAVGAPGDPFGARSRMDRLG